MAKVVANITSESGNLEAADISASTFIVEKLTEQASTNVEVNHCTCGYRVCVKNRAQKTCIQCMCDQNYMYKELMHDKEIMVF